MLAHAQLIELSLQSRCGGQCVCSTCRIVVTEGQLSPMTPSEEQLLTKVRALDGKTRLACQCFPVSETITVEVPAKPFADARQEVLK
jgi:ferredoxin